MAKNKATDIVARIVELIFPLTPDERRRVIQATLLLLGDAPVDAEKSREKNGNEQETGDLPVRARTWAKQNGIAKANLEQVFQIESGNVEIVISGIPGKNNKEKTLNSYVLTGIANLLSVGEPRFDDKSARSNCSSWGCYDQTNHSAYMKGKGNVIAGTKEKGWTLTAPGLKRGAELVQELIK